MKAQKYFLLMSSLLLILGCSNPGFANLNPPYTSNQQNLRADNARIRAKIQEGIDTTYPNSEVRVFTNDFNILVVGEVKAQKTKDSLTSFIKHYRDVKKVWNYTTVSRDPELKYNSSLVKKVKARIALEKNINPHKITVAAIGRTVYIMGTNIGNLTYLSRSIRGIYALDGVNNVIDLVTPGHNDYYSLESDSY